MLTPTQLCKCLGDDLRLSLVCLLHGQEEVCVCDLVDALEAPQSTVSRHLAQLRQVTGHGGLWCLEGIHQITDTHLFLTV